MRQRQSHVVQIVPHVPRKGRTPFPDAPSGGVQGIAGQGMAGGGHVNAYLVGPARFDPDLQQARVPPSLDNPGSAQRRLAAHTRRVDAPENGVRHRSDGHVHRKERRRRDDQTREHGRSSPRRRCARRPRGLCAPARIVRRAPPRTSPGPVCARARPPGSARVRAPEGCAPGTLRPQRSAGPTVWPRPAGPRLRTARRRREERPAPPTADGATRFPPPRPGDDRRTRDPRLSKPFPGRSWRAIRLWRNDGTCGTGSQER